MSIPARQDDTDEQLKQALPWASDPRREETNRLQEAVIEAAQRLGRDSAEPSPQPRAQPRRQLAVSFRLAQAPSSQDNNHEDNNHEGNNHKDNNPQDNNPQNDLDEINRRIWAGLMPKFVAPPPRDPIGLPGLGLTAGIVSAVAVAAAVALVVANVVPAPSISAGGFGVDEIRSLQSLTSTALGGPTKVAAIEAKTPAVDTPTVPAGTLLAAVPTNDIAAPKSPVSTTTEPPPLAQPSAPQPSSEVEVVRPEIALPKAITDPNTTAPDTTAPETRPATSLTRNGPTPSLTRNEMASLLRRGQDLIAAGDIASARLILTHLADAGDAEASFILAGTFDPAVLATRRVFGVQPDPAKAQAWYARAAEQGSSEAKRHLDQSALR